MKKVIRALALQLVLCVPVFAGGMETDPQAPTASPTIVTIICIVLTIIKP